MDYKSGEYMSIRKIMAGSIELDPSYHGWPTLIRASNGELLAVASGNRQCHICPYGRVVLYRSADEGKTWSGPEYLSKGPLDDRDAGICEAADGSILVNYFTSMLALFGDDIPEEWKKIAESITLETIKRESGFWMRRSTDGGKTWSEKYGIPVNSPHGPTLLKDGTLLFVGKDISPSPGTMQSGTREQNSFSAAVSKDNGVTWEILAPVPVAEGHDPAKCYEAYAIEAPDGTIIAHIRDHNDPEQIRTWQTESADGGRTWKPAHCLCDGFPTHMLRFGKNRLLVAYSWRNAPFGIRARISDDSGRTWGREIIISDNALGIDVGYPTTAEMPDGSLFTLWYEFTGKAAVLKYCRWIPEI